MKYYNRFVIFGLYCCALTDGIRRVGAGGLSGMGILTIILACGSWTLVLSRRRFPKVILFALAFLLFIFVSFISWMINFSNVAPFNVIQNLCIYFGFIGFIILSAIQTYRTGDLPEYITKHLTRSIQLSVILYILSIGLYGPGSNQIMGARSFGLYAATIGTPWFLGLWRCGIPGGSLWIWLTMVAVALSFSRTALAITIVLFPLSQLSFNSLKSWIRFATSVVLIGVLAFLAINFVPPIRDRFNEQGDNATVGGVKVNTSGRGDAWPIAYASALESPWIGHGPGSVGKVLLEKVGPSFTHPHNDYLRLFHDFGLTGLICWLMGHFGLIGKTWQNWQKAERKKLPHGYVHLAAFLGLIAVAIAMLSDNIIVYIFAMAPLGTIVGASLGIASINKNLIPLSSTQISIQVAQTNYKTINQ
jgi:O-antigen ligase